MLTSIHVSNFKSFGERTTFQFRPITLLYGRNSSGKSSVFHLLRYLQQVFIKREPDPAVLGIGDFASVVHGQLSAERSIDFQLDGIWNALSIYPGEITDRIGRVICQVDQAIHPFFDRPSDELTHFDALLHNRTDNLRLGDPEADDIDYSVTFSVALNDDDGKPEIVSYDLSLAAEHFMTVRTNQNNDGYIDCELNRNHGFFSCDDPLLESPKFGRDNPAHTNNLFQFWLGNSPVELMPTRGSCLPSAQRPIEFDIFLNWSEKNARVRSRMQFWINYLMYGSFVQIQRDLENLVHLGPLRQVPELSKLASHEVASDNWYDGSAAWRALEKMNTEGFANSAKWLSDPDKLNLKYGLHRRHLELRPVASSADSDLDEVSDSLAGRQMVDLWLSSESARRLKPHQVGVGVSQVVPIVAAMFDNSVDQMVVDGQCKWLLIEQPELHLHPEAQAALGDLFITATRRANCILIIETHSEPLLLRLLRRIKETTENADECPYEFALGDLSVQHLSIICGKTKIKRIAVADDGTLADDWPDDLLSLAFNETFGR